MSALTDFLKKASDAINNLRGNNNFFVGKDGDIVFSKNNVCVHETSNTDERDDVAHTPGYLTIHCQQDEAIGATLILQWLPNTTLHKNPGSIRSVSPRAHQKNHNEARNSTDSQNSSLKDDNDEISTSSEMCTTEDETSIATTVTSSEIHVEMNGDVITVTAVQERPTTLSAKDKARPWGTEKTIMFQINSAGKTQNGNASSGLGVPTINLIPNTPVDHSKDLETNLKTTDSHSQSSLSTSGADEFSDQDDDMHSSSCDVSDGEDDAISKIRESCASMLDSTPERFAMEHHLMLTETTDKDESIAIARGRAMYSSKANNVSLFSVNLGMMRSMRLFYSNSECTCGQLVIASHDSRYKILHFHHGGLDKLAQLFEHWTAIKGKSFKDGSPSPGNDRHLLICQPAVSKGELDPEDGLYDMFTWDLWRSYNNADGMIHDSITIRKAIFFASMEPSLRKEIWPFLLRAYPWMSTSEQRESIRNDNFLEYQNLRRKRQKKCTGPMKTHFEAVENTIVKDVVRTDRKKPFYAGEDNPNMETMKNILLNYAVAYPDVGYIQGMSDLLSPLLCTLRDESDTYWCFTGLMRHTVFSSHPAGNENLMEQTLEYLRELLKIMVPEFYSHLSSLGGDALQLMFVHRWILLFFKREFPEADALHIWEACWARYRTDHFHLFVCVAIVSIYGQDAINQKLPHDEILLYFSSLAMHMDAKLVLKKARGLLHSFCAREKIPCTLGGLCSIEQEQWDSHKLRQQFECMQVHGENESCPFRN